jgi:hypothetical protein
MDLDKIPFPDLVTGHQTKICNQDDKDISGRHSNISYLGFNLVGNRFVSAFSWRILQGSQHPG